MSRDYYTPSPQQREDRDRLEEASERQAVRVERFGEAQPVESQAVLEAQYAAQLARDDYMGLPPNSWEVVAQVAQYRKIAASHRYRAEQFESLAWKLERGEKDLGCDIPF